jgi:hypothetical protein
VQEANEKVVLEANLYLGLGVVLAVAEAGHAREVIQDLQDVRDPEVILVQGKRE